MGDARYNQAYRDLSQAEDRMAVLRAMQDEDIIAALAAASRAADPLLANVLATEALNRVRRSRAALKHLGEGVLILDLEERVTEANPAALSILGWTADTIAGVPLHGAIHGWRIDGNAFGTDECALLEVLRTGLPARREDELFHRRNGEAFPVAYTAAPIGAEDSTSGVVIVFSDNTARREHDAALVASEERWRQLAEASFEGIVIHVQGRVVHINRAAGEMFGVKPEEAPGRSILEFVSLNAQPLVMEAIRQNLTEPYEAECLRSNGETFLAEVRGGPFELRGEKARVVSIRDVTEQRLQQLRLRHSEQRYKGLFDMSPVPMFSLDPRGRFVELNEAAEKLTGHPAAAWIGRSFTSLIVARDLLPALTAFHKALKGEQVALKCAFRANGAPDVAVEVCAFPMCQGDEVQGIYAIARDLRPH